MTATGPSAAAPPSSAGVIIRPRTAVTPSTSKSRPLTYAPSTGSLWPFGDRSKLWPAHANAPSNRLSRTRISSQIGYDHDPLVSSARLAGSRTGSGRRIRLLNIENSAVLAPMPRASVEIATSAKPGLLRSPRSAVRTSCHTLSRVGIVQTSRASSTASVTLPSARRLACAASSGATPSRSSAS